MTTTINSLSRDIVIPYGDLLKTAFNANIPDQYANYLQNIIKNQVQTAKEIGWEMENFTYVLSLESGKITVWA